LGLKKGKMIGTRRRAKARRLGAWLGKNSSKTEALGKFKKGKAETDSSKSLPSTTKKKIGLD